MIIAVPGIYLGYDKSNKDAFKYFVGKELAKLKKDH